MQTLSSQEFQQKYGTIAGSQFNADQKQESLFGSIKNDIAFRGENNVNILNQPSSGFGDDVSKGLRMAGNTAGAVGDVAGETLSHTPIVGTAVKAIRGALGKGFNAVTNALGGTKFFQEAASGLQPGNNLEKGLQAGAGAGEVAGNILGSDVGAGGAVEAGKFAPQVVGKAGEALSSIPKPTIQGAYNAASDLKSRLPSAIQDVIPTAQGTIDHNLAKALDLTPGDLSTIEQSTGNSVGRFLSDNNLIGTNKATTQAMINNFFQQNYTSVRSAIAKVQTQYKISQVPRYTDALNQIRQTVEGIPGMEKEAAQVDNMLHLGKPVSLGDVQTVKEMLDKHFSLYSAMGDVKQAAVKQGLVNVRKEIQTFIENEVKKNTGEDIRSMNNNVQTAKSLADAIEERSPKGLTRANISNRDVMMGMGLTYFTSPLVGLAAVLIKKVATSPTIRLRFARYLDGLSDAERAKISNSLKDGSVPEEIQKVVGPLKN